MNKDTAQADPAEGSREVIERELERQEKAEVESHEADQRRSEDEDKRQGRKPH
jgi:hypothetical protein